MRQINYHERKKDKTYDVIRQSTSSKTRIRTTPQGQREGIIHKDHRELIQIFRFCELLCCIHVSTQCQLHQKNE